MSSVVVTGTGLVTAAGLGHEALALALAAGTDLVRPSPNGLLTSSVSPEHVSWPDLPGWHVAREYAGLTSQLALTVCNQALTSALAGAKAFDTDRAATIAVAADDWTEQQAFDRALASAPAASGEAEALFHGLDDEFLLRTFRWGVGYGIGALTGFQGPSAGIDSPSFGGLAGLRHALDLIESGEVDAVMLVGVDTSPRLDVVAALDHAARELGQPPLRLGQGAAALMLERSASAAARGKSPLAQVVDCRLLLDENLERAANRLKQDLAGSRPFSSAAALGTLFNASALVNLCLASEWLRCHASDGRASVLAPETWGARGAGAARLES